MGHKVYTHARGIGWGGIEGRGQRIRKAVTNISGSNARTGGEDRGHRDV